MSVENLHDVLVDMMKDVYHAEKQLVAALPKMAKAANSDALREAFTSHLEETREHVARLETAFAAIEIKPTAKLCHGMKGLIEECKEVIDQSRDESPASSDAALIAAAQKVEHYEIAAYGTMAAYASAMGHDEVASILTQTLEEEKACDGSLTELAQSSIATAMQEGDQDSEDQSERVKAEHKSAMARSRGSSSTNNGESTAKTSKSKATRHKAPDSTV